MQAKLNAHANMGCVCPKTCASAEIVPKTGAVPQLGAEIAARDADTIWTTPSERVSAGLTGDGHFERQQGAWAGIDINKFLPS